MSSAYRRVVVACLLGLLTLAACARGSVVSPDAEDNGDAGQPGEAADASGDIASPTDVQTDTDDRDTATAPCEQARCDAGLCDPDTGECVECLGDEDCPQGTCEESTHTCQGCTSDEQCPGEALCDERVAACIEPCCSITVEEAFTDLSFAGSNFDISINDASAPTLLFGDSDANSVKYARRVDGQWLAQTIADFEFSLTAQFGLAHAPDGTPHVLVGDSSKLNHYRRPDDQWKSQNLLDSEKSVSSLDLAVDETGTLHLVALLELGEEVLYMTRSPDGTSGRRKLLNLPDFGDDTPVWVNLETTGDARPLATFQIGGQNALVVAERTGSDTWSYSTVGQKINQIHGLALGPDNEPTIAYRRKNQDGLYLLERRDGEWESTPVVELPDHGYSPDLAVDSRGNPHMIYRANTGMLGEFRLHYVRWNGNDWERHPIEGLDGGFYPRIVLDEDDTPHAATYSHSLSGISYIRFGER
jgi:hypothetical protein